ncbi:MAG: gliding motility-associated C-terminal domain-containing protein [Bacteroidota bacterium]
MNKILTLIVLFNFCLTVKLVAQSNQTVRNGVLANVANFPGGCSYTWTNSNPAIGLPVSGTGDIPAFTAVNTGSTPITATITATPLPGGFAYISNVNSNTVSVISIAENRVVATIPVQNSPIGVAASTDGKRVYVVNSSPGSVSVINTATNTVIANVGVNGYSYGLCVSNDGSRVYAANYNQKTISVINTVTNTLINTISVGLNPLPTGYGPYCICISPDGTRLYVTEYDSGNHLPGLVTVINTLTNSVVAQITVGNQPEGITINSDGSRVYVANSQTGSVAVINTLTNAVIENIPVGYYPRGICLSPDGKKMYTRDGGTVELVETDLATKATLRTSFAGAGSIGIGLSSDGTFAYVPNQANNNVAVINTKTNTVVTYIPVQTQPMAVGNFITAGIACSPITFTITVNPDPTLTIGPVTGNIVTCEQTVSSAMQQFEISGTYLTGSVTLSRSGIFTPSTADGGNGGSLIIEPVNGTLAPTIVYVNTSGTSAGVKTGAIGVSSPGVGTKYADVSAFIDVRPSADPLPDVKFNIGANVSDITFLGNADKYRWINSNPAIGLPASGIGTSLGAFTAASNSDLPVVATITVIPVNNSACEGVPVYFNITVENDPTLTVSAVSGAIAGCFGVTSTGTQQFQLSGRYLKQDATVNAPQGFAVSTTSNSGYATTVNLRAVNGVLSSTTIYVKSTATAAQGANNDDIVISTLGSPVKTVAVSSMVYATPLVNAVASQQLKAKTSTYPISFSGTADQYRWTNSNTAIGLASSGTGDISAFTAINNSNTNLTAVINVTPINTSGCEGAPITFNIVVEPIVKPALILPNAFTPNGDGVNDTWVIENIAEYPKVTVKIYNRLGTIVFSSQGYSQPWNGRSGNTNLPTGTYYYLIDTNEKKVFSGYLSVVR